MATDETAQGILKLPLEAKCIAAKEAFGGLGITLDLADQVPMPVADLQAMAKLWLMLPEIADELVALDDQEDVRNLIDRLKALEGAE